MKSISFGLDIGTTMIKIVWLNRENKTNIYNTSLLTPNTSQGLQSESPFDHQEMAQLINKLVLEAKITTNSVNIALPENRVFTRVIDMPVLSEKELSSAIYWEAEQYIPAALDSMSLDWTILKKPSDAISDQKMQVLLVGAPLALIKRYQTILELAGLSIASVETEVLSVMRGIVQDSKFPTSLIMNIGSLSTSLCIVKNGVIVFVYSMPYGGMAMTRAIAADFGFTPAQAEEYKRVYGLSDKNVGEKIGKAIDPILNSIVTEVKKAITFYNEKYKSDTTISQIILTGGGADLPGLSLYFARIIGIETIIGNPWKMVDVRSVPKEVEEAGPEYTVAIGLALKEYE